MRASVRPAPTVPVRAPRAPPSRGARCAPSPCVAWDETQTRSHASYACNRFACDAKIKSPAMAQLYQYQYQYQYSRTARPEDDAAGKKRYQHTSTPRQPRHRGRARGSGGLVLDQTAGSPTGRRMLNGRSTGVRVRAPDSTQRRPYTAPRSNASDDTTDDGTRLIGHVQSIRGMPLIDSRLISQRGGLGRDR